MFWEDAFWRALLAVPVMLCGLTLTAEGSTPKVIIDPGHGGFDPGAIGSPAPMRTTSTLRYRNSCGMSFRIEG